MYTQQLSNGKVRFFERYKDPLTGKSKISSVTMDNDSSRSRKKAYTILQKRIREATLISGTVDITLSELTERYLRDRRLTSRQSSINRDEWLCKAFCGVMGGNTLLSQVSAKYVYACLEESGRTLSNRNTIMKRFKTLMTWAYQHDLIDDISFLVKLKPYKIEEKAEKLAEKYLESSELQSVIEVLPKQKWRDLTSFLALTGMRIGEALALTIDDIEDRNIHITKTKDIVYGTISDTPKTKESYRDVYIQDQLLPLIRKLRHDALAMSMVTHERLLFQDKKGGLCYGTFVKIFKTASQSVEKDLSPHSLRHTHTSLLAEQGAPLEVISRRLGHAGSDITKQVYLHVTNKQKEKDAAILKSITI